MSDELERKSLSVYDYSDKSIAHAWIAVLAYGGLHVFGATMGAFRDPATTGLVIVDAVITSVILGFLAFGIHRKSRIAVALALLFIVGTQLYVWIGLRSITGTIVSVIVTGFLLRGAKRIFEDHRELQESKTQPITPP